jgi:hypothetical protein
MTKGGIIIAWFFCGSKRGENFQLSILQFSNTPAFVFENCKIAKLENSL